MYWLWVVAAGGISLALSFLDARASGLAFVALAPLFYRIRQPGVGAIYGQALLTGLIAFTAANYWIYLFLHNLTGSAIQAAIMALVYFVYSAHSLAFLLVFLRGLRRWLPLYAFVIIAPIFAAAFLRAYPLVFELNLAQTQVQIPLMVAPVAYLDDRALTAFILFINLILAEWLAKIAENSTARSWALLLLAAPAIWLLIGWRCHLLIAPEQITHLTLGIIQTDDRPRFAPVEPAAGHTLAFPNELAQAYALAAQGAELIVWPESRPKGLLDQDWVWQSHSAHAQNMKADLMLQDLARAGDSYINASILFARNGNTALYHKMKPIPFGETIPSLLNVEPVRSRVIHGFRSIYKPVTPGTQAVVFSAAGYHVLPLICYEILDAQHLRQRIQHNPQVDLIVLQSNDSWFFSRRQVVMHNAVAQLRAVENSLPIVHVVNGGPSFLIDAQGRVTRITEHGRAGAYWLEVALSQGKK